jgi:hypothetical protein
MQPTINRIGGLKLLSMFREGLRSDAALGQNANGLQAERNHYYEERSGIGFHRDSKRKYVSTPALDVGLLYGFNCACPGP